MRKHKLSNNDGKVQVSMVVNLLLLILILPFFVSRDFRRFCLGFVKGGETSERSAGEQAAQPSLPKGPATPGTPSGEDKTNAVHRALREQATSMGLAVFNESWLQVGDSWFTRGENIATSRNYYKEETAVDYDLVERNLDEADRVDGSTFEGIIFPLKGRAGLRTSVHRLDDMGLPHGGNFYCQDSGPERRLDCAYR